MIFGWTLWLLVAIGSDGAELGSRPYLSAEGCETAVRMIAMDSGHALRLAASTVRPNSAVTLFRKDGRSVTFTCRLDGDEEEAK